VKAAAKLHKLGNNVLFSNFFRVIGLEVQVERARSQNVVHNIYILVLLALP